MKTIMRTVITVIALSVAVAGCQDSGTSATRPSEPDQSTVEVTPSSPAPVGDTGQTLPANPVSPGEITPTPADGPGQIPPTKTPVTSGNGECLDTNSGEVNAAMNSLAPAPGGTRYVVHSSLSAPLGSCPQLLWLLAATPGGTASSPWHVLFFNHDGYLGTATANATAYTEVVGSSDRSVQVRYRWLENSDPNCCPSGGPAVITFSLGGDGYTVTPNPAIPDQVSNPGS